MTDMLSERLATLVDDTAPAGWIDVRRRARRTAQRRLTLATVIVTAALALAAAVGASNGWLFSEHGDTVSGKTAVQLNGTAYTLGTDVISDGRYLLFMLARGGKTVAFASGSYVLAAPGVRNESALPDPPAPSGPPIAGDSFTDGAGQVVFGDARPGVARIVITDGSGRQFPAETVAAPKSALRMWVAALPASKATVIAAYDDHNKLIAQMPFYPRAWIGLH